MPAYIALLRGINVGGQKLVKMAALQSHFENFGATSVRTYIQSGNVVFEHSETNPATLRRNLESHLKGKLGYAVPTLIKSAKEFAAIATKNPHDTSPPDFGKRMYVCFFEAAPAKPAVKDVQSLCTTDERLIVKGDAGYAYYAVGLGRAKLSSSVIERKLGLATLRNWNTVTALLGMIAGKN